MSDVYDLMSPDFWAVAQYGGSPMSYQNGMWTGPYYPVGRLAPIREDYYYDGYLIYAANSFWTLMADRLIEQIIVTGTNYEYGTQRNLSLSVGLAGTYTTNIVNEADTSVFTVDPATPLPISDLLYVGLSTYGTDFNDYTPTPSNGYTSLSLVLTAEEEEEEEVGPPTFTVPTPTTGGLVKVSNYRKVQVVTGQRCVQWDCPPPPPPPDKPDLPPPIPEPPTPAPTPPPRAPCDYGALLGSMPPGVSGVSIGSCGHYSIQGGEE
jgi:hypothetical protein